MVRRARRSGPSGRAAARSSCIEDVVAEIARVLDVVEMKRVLADAGDTEVGGGAAGRDDEVVVGDALAVVGDEHARRRVPALDAGEAELDVRESAAGSFASGRRWPVARGPRSRPGRGAAGTCGSYARRARARPSPRAPGRARREDRRIPRRGPRCADAAAATTIEFYRRVDAGGSRRLACRDDADRRVSLRSGPVRGRRRAVHASSSATARCARARDTCTGSCRARPSG